MAQPPENPSPDPIPLLEEHTRITTRDVVTGRVQVCLSAEEVEDVVHATLAGRRATFERIAMDLEVTEAPAVRQDGDSIVVPVVEEVLVMERRRVQHAEVPRLPSDPPRAVTAHQESHE